MMTIRVEELARDREFNLDLHQLAGATGLDRVIDHTRVQKYGLALAGFTGFVHRRRVQILGNTEISYLRSLDVEARRRACDTFAGLGLACVVVTKGLTVPPELREACERETVPLFSSTLLTSAFISNLQAFLGEHLAPSTSMHGVLLEVFSVGVLLLGRSGIGKSECALDLVMRGHRLVADDVVHVKRRGPSIIYGSGAELVKHHIEVRGLGILNLKDLLGIAAVRDRKRIELVVELVQWREDEEYERLGIEERSFPILDVEVPLITIPVQPGRNIASIVEVAARNQLLKFEGHNSAREFEERLNKVLASHRLARYMATDID
ncbi:MAG: HPr(Ser) kinase/phosphatase [Pseudomonadota bacterium]